MELKKENTVTVAINITVTVTFVTARAKTSLCLINVLISPVIFSHQKANTVVETRKNTVIVTIAVTVTVTVTTITVWAIFGLS